MEQTPVPDPLIGRVVAGKYLIESILGAGAMGAVYRARQTSLDKVIALKVLHRQLAFDASFASRFVSEAMAASRLDHPNSIRVFDHGEEPDGLLYIAMEYVDGRDLFSVIEDQALLPPASIIEILTQVLAALAVAHDMGVLHRDLKPENIMVVRGKSDDGRPIDIVKVCDFGIAKIVAETSEGSAGSRGRRHSTAGTVLGTPAYLSPEQARGEACDARSDLYSVGVILYVLLTGEEPFTAESPLAVLLKHVTDEPRPPSSIAKNVDPTLEAICLKALAKKRSDRFQDAREMRHALRAAAASIDPDARAERRLASRPPPAFRDTVKVPSIRGEIRGSKRWIAIVAIVAIVVAGGSVWSYRSLRASVVAPPKLASNDVPSPTATTDVAPVPSVSAGPTPKLAFAIPSSAPSSKRSTPAPEPRSSRSARDSVTVSPTPTPTPTPTEPVITTSTATTTAIASPPPPPPPPETAPPPPIPPTPPPFDLATAHVEIGQPTNMVGGLNATNVLRTIRPAGPQLTACYRAALPRMSAPFDGEIRVHIETDGAGIIVDVRVRGAAGSAAASCFAGAIQGRTIAAVDTGTATADVPLTLKAR